MPPSKKKLLKPKELSLGSPLKQETPNIDLSNDENKLFDVDDDVGTSTSPDLSVPSEDEEEEVISNNVWEHAIDILFKLSPLHILFKLSPLHPEGKSLRKWVINIKIWMTWSCFTNGMRNIWQLENFLHLILSIHGIKATQNS